MMKFRMWLPSTLWTLALSLSVGILWSCGKGVVHEETADEKAVNTAADALSADSLTFADGDSGTSVTKSFTLISTGADDVSITWSSGNSDLITIEGNAATVTRPSDADTAVVLTATLTKGDASKSKGISVTVLQGSNANLPTDWYLRGSNSGELSVSSSGYTTVVDDTLYAAFTQSEDGSHSLRVAQLEGDEWTFIDGGANLANSNGGIMGIFLVGLKGKLYAIWSEYYTNDSKSKIHAKCFDDSSWTSIDVDSTKGMGNGKNAQYFSVYADDSKIYLAWSEKDDSFDTKIYVRSYDGTNWTSLDGGGISKGGGNNASNPSLAGFNNEVYLSFTDWQDSSSPKQLRVTKYDGSSWIFVDGDHATNGLNRSATRHVNDGTSGLVSTSDGVYAYWLESTEEGLYWGSDKSKFHFSKYDGSTWTQLEVLGSGPSFLNAVFSQSPKVISFGSELAFSVSQTISDTETNTVYGKFTGSDWVAFGGEGISQLSPANSKPFIYNDLFHMFTFSGIVYYDPQ